MNRKIKQIFTISLVCSYFFIQLPVHAMVFPNPDWQEATPQSQGMDPTKLTAALNYYASISGSQGNSQLMVIRNGYVVWKGNDIDNQHNIWSASKSFTSTVLGLLIDEGAANLNAPVNTYRAGYDPDVTFKHFATMTSGYPGNGPAAFRYDDNAQNEFARILTYAANKHNSNYRSIEQVFKQKLADPIGMDPNQWDWGDFGEEGSLTINGGAGNSGRGLNISAREMSKFCHLFLNQGNWNGRQIISPSWVREATRSHADNGNYGYNWWVNDSGRWPDVPRWSYHASGFNHNRCFIIHDWNIVITRLGTDGNMDNQSNINTFLRMIGESFNNQTLTPTPTVSRTPSPTPTTSTTFKLSLTRWFQSDNSPDQMFNLIDWLAAL